MTREKEIAELKKLLKAPYQGDKENSYIAGSIDGKTSCAKRFLKIIDSLEADLKEMIRCRDNALEMPLKLAEKQVELNQENQDLFDENKELKEKLEIAKNALNLLDEECLGDFADKVIEKALNEITGGKNESNKGESDEKIKKD